MSKPFALSERGWCRVTLCPEPPVDQIRPIPRDDGRCRPKRIVAQLLSHRRRSRTNTHEPILSSAGEAPYTSERVKCPSSQSRMPISSCSRFGKKNGKTAWGTMLESQRPIGSSSRLRFLDALRGLAACYWWFTTLLLLPEPHLTAHDGRHRSRYPEEWVSLSFSW
jgi:hypothetical protein